MKTMTRNKTMNPSLTVCPVVDKMQSYVAANKNSFRVRNVYPAGSNPLPFFI